MPKTNNKDGRVGAYKLNDNKVEIICDALRKGNYVTTACRSAGISVSTYNRWKKLGEEGVEGYKDFFEAIDQAEAEGEMLLQENIHDAGLNGQWQASAWILERKYPQKWARTERVDLSTDNDFKISIASKKSTHQMEEDEKELLEND